MIGKKDFIDAIGKPDAGFTEAVDSALAVIRAREERKKPRRYYMILPAAAAVAIFVVFMGVALRGGFAPKKLPGNVLAQPQNVSVTQTPVAFTPSPAPAETPQPTLEAEEPYVTYTQAPEEYPTARPYDSNELPGLTLEDDEISVIQYLFDGNVTALYPGFELTDITREVASGREVLARWINNGVYEMAVKWIEISTPRQLPAYIADSANGRRFYAVTLDIPASQERIDMMMDTGYEWQKTIYEASLSRMEDTCSEALRTDEYFMLTGMTVYLDENGIINYIEMFFGDEFKGYLLWRYESYDGGDYGYELLLDEYGVYGFEDIFGDPAVSATVEPTPAPVNQQTVYPDEYYLFDRGFELDLSLFWPGYEHSGTETGTVNVRGDDKEGDFWMLSDGNNRFVAAWLTRGEIMLSDKPYNSYHAPTLSVKMPDDPLLIDSVMQNARIGLTEAYFKSRSYVCELLDDPDAMQKGWELAGVRVTFDENEDPSIYEFFFGSEQIFYFMFVCDDDGSYVMEMEYFDETGEYFNDYFSIQ